MSVDLSSPAAVEPLTNNSNLLENPPCLHPYGSHIEPTVSHFTFRSSRHFLENGERLKKFFSGSQLCDIRIKCTDGTVIEAHRIVLAASSDYFAAMFTGSMNESRQNEICINLIDSVALKCLITYCYTGEISLCESSVENLLSGACLLQLAEVIDACSEYLLNQLHPSNCLGIRNFADAQGCQKLKNSAESFTADHFTEVVHQSEFLLLPPDDLYKLLSSDDLNVLCESMVFQALISWLKHDLLNRRQYSKQLLSAVRLAALPARYLVERVHSDPIFHEDHASQDLIVDAFKYHLLAGKSSAGVKRCRKATAGALYIVGGMDANKGALTIERFSYTKNQWLTVGQLDNRRLQFGVAVFERKILVVGGREGLKALNAFDCWDSDVGTWTSMAPMISPRHGLAVAILENVIYAIGGHDGWSYLSSVERWYPSAKTWSSVPEMTSARSGAGVAVLGGKIYMFGGRDGSQCLQTCEFYSPHTNKWTPIASMGQKRGSVGVGVLHNQVYVVGGLESPSCNGSAALTRYQCVERYNPKTNQWSPVANLSIGRDGIAVCTLADRLFAIGGYSGQHYLPIVEVYNDESNQWSRVADLVNGRAGACAAVIPSSILDYGDNNNGLATNSTGIDLKTTNESGKTATVTNNNNNSFNANYPC